MTRLGTHFTNGAFFVINSFWKLPQQQLGWNQRRTFFWSPCRHLFHIEANTILFTFLLLEFLAHSMLIGLRFSRLTTTFSHSGTPTSRE